MGPQRAEDLTAETFCRAMAAFDRYEDRGIPPRAWLLRIAFNLIVADSRRTRTFPVDVDDGLASVDARTDAVNDRVEISVLLKAMETLPVKQRAVIDLRFVQDLSISETAAVLDTNEDAVRALSYRALKALRAAHKTLWEPGAQSDE